MWNGTIGLGHAKELPTKADPSHKGQKQQTNSYISFRQTLFCIQTITHEYPLDCCKFCPGDRHFIAGASSGHLIMGDFAQNKITQAELLNNDDSDM